MPTLEQWLERLGAEQPKGMSLGLERISRVISTLGLKPCAPVITVAGTNGKGSTCAYLEAILAAAGYKPLAFYSPHLLEFTERIRINGEQIDPDELAAFFDVAATADAKRPDGESPLSYFEHVAVAAVLAGNAAGCGAFVLEVGLGGRLDAINAFDTDVAVITSVDLDHVEHLGPNREAIGAEKAGILRHGKPLVLGDRNPPASVLARAADLNVPVRAIGSDFSTEISKVSWTYRGAKTRAALPRPLMAGLHQFGNAACALAALDELSGVLPVDQAQIRSGLHAAKLRGRCEIIPGSDPPVVLDVAHNAAGAKALANALLDMGHFPDTQFVLAMHSRKDAEAFVAALKRRASHWHLAPLADAADGEEGLKKLSAALAGSDAPVTEHDSVAAAFAGAKEAGADRIVVTGSFLTIEEHLRADRGVGTLN